MLLRDFNLTIENWNLDTFMGCFGLESLINAPTCFRRCIDLILANKKNFFKNSNILEVGISDRHNLVLTVLRSKFIKASLKMKF